MRNFYQIFIQLCKDKGVAGSKVAQSIGLNKSSVSYWKKGATPKAETLKALAQYFNVTVDYLTGLETFNSGADFDKRRKELLSQAQAAGNNADRLTIIHTKDPRKFIDFALDQMNEEGRAKVAERAAEVLEVPKYRKDAPKD